MNSSQSKDEVSIQNMRNSHLEKPLGAQILLLHMFLMVYIYIIVHKINQNADPYVSRQTKYVKCKQNGNGTFRLMDLRKVSLECRSI
jgi:hypothetical protein